ncbi:hypothetical protein B0T11DRAFT_106887 [Plectosphaerella cucumerina]|uniref:Endoplasmic reticulum junction formation protein lunapark n=1 Tax=Plectosphaerella cucumerina TaxID=40658 RepID=A0A8K0TFQ1_9PEZI|nr:hypothetical protein B0T11DRAFT_106887 [Plectosphaerella cucumerina]
MVSFWPWKGDDSSPASFEKALSTLSVRIADLQARLERQRATSRRVRVLWMIYLSLAYLIYSIVMVLVVGYYRFGPWDWSGVALGPVLIYVTRLAITSYFNFRIDSLTEELERSQEERAKTIQKLKDATKYDSTLQLLEKYGGKPGSTAEPKSKGNLREGDDEGPGRGQQQQHPGQRVPSRTNMPPPPTANIQRRDAPPSSPGSPQPDHAAAHQHGPTNPPVDLDTNAKFAPNAFLDQPPHYAQTAHHDGPPSWYDRVMDLLLGEDEAAAKNRIVLICKSCRQVNGQAPPGTRSLSELGIWKCMTCGASNGEVNEGKRLIKEVLDARAAQSNSLEPGEEFKDDDDDDAEDVGQEDIGPEGRTTGKHSDTGTRKRRGRK